ncbi:MAG: hypothetical protein LBC71_05895 [Oscillospiraceae bacterium]|jgi:hypothetical protein|nr:hypothetical protein [Oscillospiraceae bacterium]
MRISVILIPVISILLGVLGFFLRASELANVFDPITGLPMRGAATTFWLVTLTVAFLLAIAIFAIITTILHRSPRGFENAFGTDPLFYPISFVVISLVWLLGTLLFYFDNSTIDRIDASFVIFSAVSAVCVTFFAIEMYQDARKKASYAFCLVPTIFLCFWLVLLYRQNAANPILLSYVYQCLAIAVSALSFFYTAGFLYDKPAPGKAIFCYSASIYFCIVSMADDIFLGLKIIFGAVIAVNVLHSSMLLKNLQKK